MKLKPLAAAASIMLSIAAPAAAQAAPAACDRACLSGMADALLSSMVAHKPELLSLADVYTATENSHPAALGMMAAWRTITKAGKPSLLAIDPAAGQAYLALDVEEGGGVSVLWGRFKVVDRKITELEFFINRARGDHGFSFSPEQLPANYQRLMTPAASRTKASHAELAALAKAAFDADDPLPVEIADDCQFTELGWKVVDPGLDDVAPTRRPG